MRGYHDIGGNAGAAIDPAEEPAKFWERQLEAMRTLLGDAQRRLCTVDELRRGFESFGEEKYRRLRFYERRFEALVDILVEKQLIDRRELERRIAEVLDGREERS